MKDIWKLSLGLFAAIFIHATSFAAGDHKDHGHAPGKHDEHAHKPKYGGVVTEVKEVQYELVAKPESIAIYVEDHGKKVDTKGAAAKVTLLSGSTKTEVTLVPAGDNKLEAKGNYKFSPGTKAIAVVTLAGKSAVNVKFSLK